MCGRHTTGKYKRADPKPTRGMSKRTIFCFFCFPKLCWEFRVLLFFCLHIQTKGSMCPSGMSAEVTVNDSARSKHPKTTHTHTRKKPKQKNHTKKLWLCCLWCFVVYVCVCGVPKPVLKNVAECSQHGMTWDRPKSWKNGWKGRKKERRRRKRRRRHLIFWSLSLSLSLFLTPFFSVGVWDLLSNANFHKLRIWDAKKKRTRINKRRKKQKKQHFFFCILDNCALWKTRKIALSLKSQNTCCLCGFLVFGIFLRSSLFCFTGYLGRNGIYLWAKCIKQARGKILGSIWDGLERRRSRLDHIRQSRTKVWGSKMIRYRRSPLTLNCAGRVPVMRFWHRALGLGEEKKRNKKKDNILCFSLPPLQNNGKNSEKVWCFYVSLWGLLKSCCVWNGYHRHYSFPNQREIQSFWVQGGVPSQGWNLKELTEWHHKAWSMRLNLTQHGKCYQVRTTPGLTDCELFLDSSNGGAWPFLVGGVICLVDSDNERDLYLKIVAGLVTEKAKHNHNTKLWNPLWFFWSFGKKSWFMLIGKKSLRKF